ncbi:hypothetical protein KPL71_008031 [Citrus sinensis]|uniref:Uncharacterized protein n=1 Tax=Citrus sinensis TaxID=2711 RepID=A0ACB8M3E9_CITSI|nr:hypothetical protein KPL71_008031 [Citrus sinensis]
MNDRMQRLEESLKALSNAVLSSKASQSSHSVKQGHMHQYQQDVTESSRLNIPPLRAKIECPRFAGDDPTEWFNRVAQFFEFQRTPEDQKVSLASFHLEDGEDFDEALSHITQNGSLRDNQHEFEKLGNRVQGWTQKALIGTFMGGLKLEVADGIRMFKPKTLKEAISLARTRDEQLTRQKRFTWPIPQNRPLAAVTPVNQRAAIAPKRLGWEEMQKRRAQGLCFSCNERFTPGHKCQGPRLLLIESHNNSQENEEETESEGNREEKLEVFIHALTGWSSPRTMRVAASIKSQLIMVLIDSGSTHNFLSEKVASTLRLPVVPTKSFTVRVANGERLICQGRYEKVPIDLQGIPFSLTFYSLPLAGLDMLLGIQWLEMLGSVVCNWKHLTMDFNWENQARRLQGIQRAIQVTSIETVAKEHRQGQMVFAVYVQNLEDSSWDSIQLNMQQLLNEFEDVFQEPSKLPPLREIDHHIPLKEGTQPINVRSYRYAYFQKAEIEKQVQAMLNVGIIQPSTSPFSSPIFLVKKKDDTWRFCTDYRALNTATIKDRFPIPTVDDMLDELYGVTYFTKLDLQTGYHQVRVHAPDISKTAFRTHNGHFEYLVMPFGLCNAPSTFQAIMNSIFHPYLRQFILVFFYDILVYSPTWELHLTHVRKTLEILKKHSFFIKANKCDFGKHKLEYLGHILTNQGVKVDGKKIEAMVAWPQPTNTTELRGFLGLTGYYRKFVGNYGVLAHPLTNLLKKGNFKWDEDAVSAFTMLKQAMTTTPTLAMPNFNEPFTIETNASEDGIGAVLTQQGRPIAYMSRALGIAKRTWSIYAKAMLAIMEAIRTWRPYILGRKFFIQTDQRSLKYFLKQRVGTPEQQKWVAKLLGYDYEIIYQPGKENLAADALSRRPNSPLLNQIFISQVSLWDDIRKAAETDLYMKKIFQQAANDPTGNYVVKNGLCFYKQRVVVPPALRDQLLHEFHDSKVAGHSGVLRTFKRLAQQFYWPSMHKSVQEYIQQCATCQKTKSETLAPAGLLQPLPIPCLVWDNILLDFIEGLPSSHGKDSIIVVVDRFSNSAYFIALSHLFSAKIIAEKFVEHVIKLHGMLKSIISDRDPIFQLKTNLELAAARMKHVADQKRREVEFQVGDLVLLKLYPYRQQSMFKRAHHKLASRFYGPFPVEQQLGKVAYRLSLPPAAQIHPIQVVPEKVIDTRWVRHGTKFIEESLVQWKTLPAEDATWEET